MTRTGVKRLGTGARLGACAMLLAGAIAAGGAQASAFTFTYGGTLTTAVDLSNGNAISLADARFTLSMTIDGGNADSALSGLQSNGSGVMNTLASEVGCKESTDGACGDAYAGVFPVVTAYTLSWTLGTESVSGAPPASGYATSSYVIDNGFSGSDAASATRSDGARITTNSPDSIVRTQLQQILSFTATADGGLFPHGTDPSFPPDFAAATFGAIEFSTSLFTRTWVCSDLAGCFEDSLPTLEGYRLAGTVDFSELAAVPEPGSMALLAAGALALATLGSRRRRRS